MDQCIADDRLTGYLLVLKRRWFTGRYFGGGEVDSNSLLSSGVVVGLNDLMGREETVVVPHDASRVLLSLALRLRALQNVQAT